MRTTATMARVAIALISLGLATGLALIFRSVGITESSIVLLYLLSVVVASVASGRALGIAASLVAVIVFNFLFTEPRFTFVVNDPQYLVTFPVMLIVAAISSELTARIRRQAEEAERRELLTKRLYESSRSLLGTQGRADIIRVAARHLQDLTGCTVVCAVDDGSGSPSFPGFEETVHTELLAGSAARLLGRSEAATPQELDAKGSRWRLIPVGAQGRTLAVIAVETGREPLPPVAEESIRAVVVQLALALDREEMSRREQNAKIEIERERLRANLLQSISHDLRSPLAAIVGSASTLIEESAIDDKTRSELAESIREDARWLTGLVENLLSLTRAEESAVRFQGSVEVLDDVVSAALGRIEKIYATHRVEVDFAREPVLVRMDSGLIEQLIMNLLQNAIQHTPAGTTIRVTIRSENGSAYLTVADDGPGLSNRALDHAFERFYTERALPDARRGMGLGLSICRSIAEAHDGAITASNRPEGGALFEVRLHAEASSSLGEATDEGE